MPADDDFDDLPSPTLPAPARTEVPPAKPPKAAPPAPAPQKQTHTQRLVKLALDAGFTQADLDKYPSDVIWDELNRIRELETRARPAPPPVESAKQPAPDRDELATLLDELDADQTYDPKLAKALRLIQKRADLTEVHKKLERVDALEQAEQARATQRLARIVDTAFAKLPEEYHDFVGTGPMDALTDPGQQGWRRSIFQTAKLDFAKDSPARVAEKIAAAAEQLAGARVKPAEQTVPGYGESKPAKKQPRGTNGRFTPEEFAAGHVARPSGRLAGAEQETVGQAAARIMREHGDPRGNTPVIGFDDDDLPE